jgi:RNA polymerase sigma factor (sigma-70 family)
MELACKHNRTIPESFNCCKNTSVDMIYKECLPTVKFLVISNSGTEDDALDIFHDALMIILKNSDKKEFELHCSIKTYVYSVCFNLWQRELTKRCRQVAFSDYYDLQDESDPEHNLHDEQIFDIYLRNFKSLKLEYQKVLNMYLLKFSMKKIMNEMGYASEKYAKVKKFICKEQLKKAIYNDPIYKELYYINSN